MKTRQELKVKFSDHQCPSGADYASIFDSTINLANDAIVLPDPLFKGPNPLTINAIRDKKYALRLNHQLQIQQRSRKQCHHLLPGSAPDRCLHQRNVG